MSSLWNLFFPFRSTALIFCLLKRVQVSDSHAIIIMMVSHPLLQLCFLVDLFSVSLLFFTVVSLSRIFRILDFPFSFISNFHWRLSPYNVFEGDFASGFTMSVNPSLSHWCNFLGLQIYSSLPDLPDFLCDLTAKENRAKTGSNSVEVMFLLILHPDSILFSFTFSHLETFGGRRLRKEILNRIGVNGLKSKWLPFTVHSSHREKDLQKIILFFITHTHFILNKFCLHDEYITITAVDMNEWEATEADGQSLVKTIFNFQQNMHTKPSLEVTSGKISKFWVK